MALGVLTAVVVLAFLFNQLLANQFIGPVDNIMAVPFTFWDVFDDRFYRVQHPPTVGTLIKVFMVSVVVALWAITYVRLKEKEI